MILKCVGSSCGKKHLDQSPLFEDTTREPKPNSIARRKLFYLGIVVVRSKGNMLASLKKYEMILKNAFQSLVTSADLSDNVILHSAGGVSCAGVLLRRQCEPDI